MITSSRPSPLTSPAPATEYPLLLLLAAPSMRNPWVLFSDARSMLVGLAEP